MQVLSAFKVGLSHTLIYIKVSAPAKENKLVGAIVRDNQNYIKINLKANKIKNQANLVLINFLSNLLGVNQNQVKIKSGLTTSLKIIEIQGVTLECLHKELLKC